MRSFLHPQMFCSALALAAVFTTATARAAVISNPVSDGTIVLDASRDDWTGLGRYADDGNEGYPIDIGYITLAHDSQNLYVRYQMYFPSPAFSGAWKLLIDTDQSASTGYYGQGAAYQNALGAERMVEGASTFSFTGGTQDAFSWNWEGFGGFTETGAGGNDIELTVPRAWLGNPSTFNFVLWIDSNSNGGIDGEGAGGDDHLANGAFGGTTANVHTYSFAAVPEPTSVGVLGVVAVAGLRRRR